MQPALQSVVQLLHLKLSDALVALVQLEYVALKVRDIVCLCFREIHV